MENIWRISCHDHSLLVGGIISKLKSICNVTGIKSTLTFLIIIFSVLLSITSLVVSLLWVNFLMLHSHSSYCQVLYWLLKQFAAKSIKHILLHFIIISTKAIYILFSHVLSFCFNRCSICLGEYEEKEILRIMPSCHHNFHLACIDVWLQKQTTCPICRLPLNESLEAKSAASPLFDDQMDGSHEVSDDQYNQWILPSGHHAERMEITQEIHEPEYVVVGVSYHEGREART